MATNTEEQLSALVDGELSDGETSEVLASLRGQPHLRERWARYHVISDGLRKGLPLALNHDLQARVSRALASEPLMLVPVSRRRVSGRAKLAAGLALAASVAAAVILGLHNGDVIQLPWVADAPASPKNIRPAADNDLAPYLVTHNESVAPTSYGILPYTWLVGAENTSE